MVEYKGGGILKDVDMRFNRREKEQFLRLLESGRLPHAFIVEGPEGVGKFTFSLFASTSILCTGKNRPCGSCDACIKLRDGNHPDLYIISPEKESSQIKVEEVREIKKSVYMLPNEGDKKVYIIKDGQKMNVQAQNALLKLFEEPPESSVFFILTDNRESLLPTVVSRGHIITLCPSKPEDIMKYLKELYPKKTAEELENAVNMCEGSPGKALTLLEKKYGVIRNDVLEYASLLFSHSGFACMSFFKSKRYDRSKAKDFMLTLFLLFSDVMRAKKKSDRFVFLPPETAYYYAKLTTETKLALISEEILRSFEAIDANSNLNLTFSVFAAKVSEIS